MSGKTRYSALFMNEIKSYFERSIKYDGNTTDTTYTIGGSGCFLGIKIK